jgi:DNA modification methylase
MIEINNKEIPFRRLYNILSNFEPVYTCPTFFERVLANLEQVRYHKNKEDFYKETAYCNKVNNIPSYYSIFSKIRGTDFTRGSGYLTHGITEYQGRFHAQMVRALINYCDLNKNSVILDCHCGTGTTLVEASLLNFNSIGIDINPIACLDSVIKTSLLRTDVNYLIQDNKRYFDLGYYRKFDFSQEDFNKFLRKDIKELFYYFLYIKSSISNFSGKDKAFRYNYRMIIGILEKFQQLKKRFNLDLGKTHVYCSDNINLMSRINSDSIDAIITSPPYLDILDYISNSKPQLENFFGISEIHNMKKNSIGNRLGDRVLREKNYWRKVEIMLNQSYRILKDNGNLILVIGNIRDMKEKYGYLSNKVGFFINMILLRDSIVQKKVEDQEYVLFLQKI